MNRKRITIYEDEKYLRQISKDVSFDDNSLSNDINDLIEHCKKEELFALAAIQIGIPKRIVYIKNTTLDIPISNLEYNQSQILINPKIKYRKGHTKFWENCASCVDNMGLVSRPYKIKIEYKDENNKKHIKTFTGFEATVLSHEIDHLNGILHIDIAEQILNMPKEERAKYRKSHPYEIISKNCDYEKIWNQIKKQEIL